MPPPISSPVSSNSFPSSSTSRGHDENNFHFHSTTGWPTTNSMNTTNRKLNTNSTGGGPLSIQSNPQTVQPHHHLPKPQQQQHQTEGWNMGDYNNTAVPPPVASSPLPPRSSSAGKLLSPHLQSSPLRLTTIAKQFNNRENGVLPQDSRLTLHSHTVVNNSNDRQQQTAVATVESFEAVRSLSEPLNPKVQQHTISTTASSTGRSITGTTQRSRDSPSVQSQVSGQADPWNWENDLDSEEQMLFEQRLTEDAYGIVVRKISHTGKSNLRYIKCCDVDAAELDVDSSGFSSTRSLSSHNRPRFPRFRDRSFDRSDSQGDVSLMKGKKVKVLIWGKKKDIKMPLERFVCVRKGKSTDRSRRNASPASRILSLITDDPHCPSLDIEAPTRLDRDKFARAFSRFLRIPLDGDDVRSIRSDITPQSVKDQPRNFPPQSPGSAIVRQVPAASTLSVVDQSVASSYATTANSQSIKKFPLPIVTTDKVASKPTAMPKAKKAAPPAIRIPQSQESSADNTQSNQIGDPDLQMASLQSTGCDESKEAGPKKSVSVSKDMSVSDRQMPTNKEPSRTQGIHLETDPDAASVVSSITGGGFDHEIVEELHLALTEMRAELEESRAEAARAVKVAEQAIQSAENSNSKDWNSTVTHKAAEAAALAQKKSAEAMAKLRVAEEKLEQERRNASSWKKQAESAAEEAGHWQTRAAAAEVQRALMADALDGERQKKAGGIHDIEQAPQMMGAESELERLRAKLALESATRRKLLNEVQDLRGNVRVYCRPRKATQGLSTISTPSQDLLMLHRELAAFNAEDTNIVPLSFEFDGIWSDDMDQQDVFSEIEALCLSGLDGYNVCLMACGPPGSGKTYSMLGEVEYDDATGQVSISDYGMHLRAAKQFFSVLNHRKDRYRETVTFSIVEVTNDRLVDLLVGTEISESNGRLEESRRSSRRKIDTTDGNGTLSTAEKPSRLEIKTNRDGETTVHGLLSIDVSCFEDILEAWKQCLARRRQRLLEHGANFSEHDKTSHVIGTLKVISTNLSTGAGTKGKIQFVDLAASDVVPKRSSSSSSKRTITPEAVMAGVGNNQEWKFANRSMGTLSDVVAARSQFQRKVPYRNATITHLLSDSLEADTKVALVACVSSELKDLQATACTLKFAQTLRKVVIGKATKHCLTRG